MTKSSVLSLSVLTSLLFCVGLVSFAVQQPTWYDTFVCLTNPLMYPVHWLAQVMVG